MKIIIFTDLDGTLLNHHDYDFSDARPALDRIKRHRIPLIIVTSKTRREVELFRNALGMKEPFVVENGGGVFFPALYRGWVLKNVLRTDRYDLIQLGLSYGRIRRFFAKTGPVFGARGFGDMSVREIASLTGLSENKARLAKAREFTEPFVLEDGKNREPLAALAEKQGMKITSGGRFFHLIGEEQDKGRAVGLVRDLFQRQFGEKMISIGLGDSENDRLFLEQVDIPVLIPHPEHGYLDMDAPGLVRARTPGSRGWNEVMEGLLNAYAIQSH